MLKTKTNCVTIGLLFLVATLQGCVAYMPQPFYSPAQIGFSTYPSFGYSSRYIAPAATFNFIPRFFGGYSGGFSSGFSGYSHGSSSYSGGFSSGFRSYSHDFSSYSGGFSRGFHGYSHDSSGYNGSFSRGFRGYSHDSSGYSGGHGFGGGRGSWSHGGRR